MNRTRLISIAAASMVAALGVGTFVVAHDNQRQFDENLSGYQEVPALSTSGNGTFTARVNKDQTEIKWELTFSALESDADAAHIHFENPTNNGGIVLCLCTNLGNAPAGIQVQACPTAGGTISGTAHVGDISGSAAARGSPPGNSPSSSLRCGAATPM